MIRKVLFFQATNGMGGVSFIVVVVSLNPS